MNTKEKDQKIKINMIKQIRDTHRRRKKQVKENDHTWKNVWHNATMAHPKNNSRCQNTTTSGRSQQRETDLELHIKSQD